MDGRLDQDLTRETARLNIALCLILNIEYKIPPTLDGGYFVFYYIELYHISFAFLRICKGVCPICFFSILRRNADEQRPRLEAIASTERSVVVSITTARSAIS